jgi:glycosyltransferase involved in cell wall biosynthesis
VVTFRVLHLSTFDVDSGAARGMFWLHRRLREQSIDSSILVSRKSGSDPTVHALKGSFARLAARARMRTDQWPLRRYRKTDDAFWTVGWLPSGIERQIRVFDPDIVHLHWTGNGFLGIKDLARIDRPMVWTLRDMWAFTGGCHYTSGCDHYRGMCGGCPQLRSDDQHDLSRVIWTQKEAYWRDLNLRLVPISEWMADCVRESTLLRSFPTEVIPNGVDTSRFRPQGRLSRRAIWRLPPEARVIAFGAINATRDHRKGFPQLMAALQALGRSGQGTNLVVVVFGDTKPEDMPDLGIDIRFVGFMDDDQKLAELYSCADAAVVPSLEEAFGKTVIEAMACGTPVVAFDHGGPKDIITHRVDGYLAQAFSVDDLAAGMLWCVDQSRTDAGLRDRARAKAVERFDIGVVADRYVSLYERILQESPKPADARYALEDDPGHFMIDRTLFPGSRVHR